MQENTIKEGKFATKTTVECNINNQDVLIKQFFNICFPGISYVILENKKILVLNVECLSSYLSPKNNVKTATTSLEKFNILNKRHNDSNLQYLNINIKMKNKEILKELTFYLKNNIKLNSMDYIISNLPYKRDLYLSISELLLNYINDNGKLLMVGPLNTIASPTQMSYKIKYNELWKHLERYKELPVDMYYGENKIFDQYGDYTFLGILSFIKKTTSFNIYTEWERFQEPQAVKLIQKIKQLNIPTLNDAMIKNTNHGILVPLTNVTGGYDRKNRAVYMDFVYYDKGKCYVKGNVVPLSEMQNSNKIARAVRMKTKEQAVRFHSTYRDNYLLQGFASLSCGGTRHLDYTIIPYFSCEADTKDADIINMCKLNEDDINLLKKYSKPFKVKQPQFTYRLF